MRKFTISMMVVFAVLAVVVISPAFSFEAAGESSITSVAKSCCPSKAPVCENCKDCDCKDCCKVGKCECKDADCKCQCKDSGCKKAKGSCGKK